MTNHYDALWWTIVTVTTVSYGDIVPMAAGGRIIALILMFFGIGIVGLVISNIADAVVNKGAPGTTLPFDNQGFDSLPKDAQRRIIERLEHEIELELFRQHYADRRDQSDSVG